MRRSTRPAARALGLAFALTVTLLVPGTSSAAAEDECTAGFSGVVSDVTTLDRLAGLRVELVERPWAEAGRDQPVGAVLATATTGADGAYRVHAACQQVGAYVRVVDPAGFYAPRYSTSGSGGATVTDPRYATAVSLMSETDWRADLAMVGSGRYRAAPPFRVLDTRRTGNPVHAGGSTTFLVGPELVDMGTVAVVLNVTATEGTAPTSFVSLLTNSLPERARTASLLNATAGRDVANLVTVPVERLGPFPNWFYVTLYNDQGSTHLVADLVGGYTTDDWASGGFVPAQPTRVLDTRTSAPVGPGGTVDLPLAAVAPPGAIAVALTLTSTETTAATSYVSAYRSAVGAEPTTSSLNAYRGEDISNLAVVWLGAHQSITLYNDQGSTHLVADLVGWFVKGTGAEFHPIDPWRTYSSGPPQQRSAVTAGETRSFLEPSAANPVPDDAVAVALNLTTASPTVSSYLTAFSTGSGRPYASSTNSRAGADVATSALSGVGPGISVYNDRGTVTVLPDVYGYFTDRR